MRRLVYLAALVAAAPDTDTQLKRAAALARWVDRTGPAPPSWTVAGPKDVTVGPEVHAGKIKKVSRATVDLGGSSVVVVKTIAHGDNEGTLLMELLFLHALRGAPGVPDLYGAWFDDDRVTYVVADGGEPVARKKGLKPILGSAPFKARAAAHPVQLARSLVACFASWAPDWVGARQVPRRHVCFTFRKDARLRRRQPAVAAPLRRGPRDGRRPGFLSGVDPPRVGRGSRRPAVVRGVGGGDRSSRRWRNRALSG